jgi:thiol-disulfide isomerase/thioredoxin
VTGAVLGIIVVALAVVTLMKPQVTGDVKPTTTKVYALVHHADWCHLCRELQPKLTPVVSDAVGEGVEFVTYDFTTPITTTAAAGAGSSIFRSASRGETLPVEPRTAAAVSIHR